jgi:hypothetical protein
MKIHTYRQKLLGDGHAQTLAVTKWVKKCQSDTQPTDAPLLAHSDAPLSTQG